MKTLTESQKWIADKTIEYVESSYIQRNAPQGLYQWLAENAPSAWISVEDRLPERNSKRIWISEDGNAHKQRTMYKAAAHELLNTLHSKILKSNPDAKIFWQPAEVERPQPPEVKE
jgi:cobalamin biosynthesis Mg chelatase CobN